MQTPLKPEPKVEPVPEPIYRPSDVRPQHDDLRARELGIGRYESQRLLLYTDIDPEIAQTLPPLVDALYANWVSYFGPLPPDREGTEYQITAYLISEADRFRAAKMLPEQLPQFEHGRHLGRELWLFDQKFDYYREHLLLHEATHCFMTTMPGPLPPLWYMEGMAEYFALHQRDAEGRWDFGGFPRDTLDLEGFGGVELIKRTLRTEPPLTVSAVTTLSMNDFAVSKTLPYAWSWLLCHYLNEHPRYRDRMHALGQHLGSQSFYELQTTLFRPDLPLLETEWALYLQSLDYDYDVRPMAIDFRPAEPISATSPVTVSVPSNGGWQCSGVTLTAGDRVEVRCRGRVVMAQQPRPWESEGQGITIRYINGKPLGRLLGAILPTVDNTGVPTGPSPQTIEVLDLGASSTITAVTAGTLYLRVNDAWSELDDNSGAYEVQLSTTSEEVP